MATKNGASSIEKEQIFGMAEKEMEYRVDLFNRFECMCCGVMSDSLGDTHHMVGGSVDVAISSTCCCIPV
ncbi:hypothetical protein C4D60_Mb06t15550 [Musa balbisiana]|uniref:Uncharacterized protein n=1 Tax=Musa balbisiana TaxID=52838 RepID=A0A4S8IN82_MUSBA|nr:hypothetical protein C4D60_Mb06t15550 [Musa balbisiana]